MRDITVDVEFPRGTSSDEDEEGRVGERGGGKGGRMRLGEREGESEGGSK